MSIVWLDGELVDKADAKVGVADHGLLFGDLVSVDMRAYGGRVFRLARHLEGLQSWANGIGLSLPIGGGALAAAIDATLKANQRSDGFVKVVVTRGAGPLTLDPRKCVPVMFIVAEEAAPFPRDLYDCGLDVITRVVCPPTALKVAALRAGCLEGLGASLDGRVTGGSETAVGWVTGGAVRAGDGDPTHDAVAELAGAVERRPPFRDELLAADEVFLTSAAAEIIAVRTLDGKRIGGGGEGPVTRRLRQEFRALVRAECAVS